MSRMVRRHWRLVMLNLLLILAGFVLVLHVLLRNSPRASAQTVESSSAEASTASPTDAASVAQQLTQLKVQELRQRLSLQDETLAAMGCSQDQATQILSALVNWTSQNASNASTAEQAVAAAQANLAEAQRRINVGPRYEQVLASLPTLQQSCNAAKAQVDQLYTSAAEVVSGQLNAAQQQIWATVKANTSLGVPQAYRYNSNLTANDAAGMQVSAYRGVPTSINNSAETSQNIRENMPTVITAEKATLPAVNQ